MVLFFFGNQSTAGKRPKAGAPGHLEAKNSCMSDTIEMAWWRTGEPFRNEAY